MSLRKESLKDGSRSLVDKIIYMFSLITIEPSLLVHMTASFMGNLLLSNLQLYKACNVNLGFNETFCENLVDKPRGGSRNVSSEEEAVQEVVAQIKTWSSVLDNSFPILFVLFLGAWSDIYGRKIPYVLSISGYIIRYALLILATYFSNWSAETVAVLAALPVALTGSRTAISMIIYSYVADTTTVKERTIKMGMATAVRTFGKSLGSALGGHMAKRGLGYYWIFGIAGGLDLFGLFYVILFLKDNDGDKRKGEGKSGKEKLKAVFNLRNVKEAVEAFFRKREGGGRGKLFLLVIALMSTMIPMQAEESLLYQFTRIRLGWDAGKYGYYNTFRMIVAFIGGLTSVGLLSGLLKLSDAIIGVLSSLSQISSSFIYCYATTDWMIYLAPVVDVLNGTMIIVIRSMISKIIPRGETGKVNSFIGMLDTVTPLPASPSYSALYDATLSSFTGAIFILSAIVTLPALLIFIFLGFFWENRSISKDDRSTTTVINEEKLEDVENNQRSQMTTDGETEST